MGQTSAATDAARVVDDLRPRHVIVVGIAAGRRSAGIALGDVIVAKTIVDYELQKVTPDGPVPKNNPPYRTDSSTHIAARNYDAGALHAIERPDGGRATVHVGSVASGNKVIKYESWWDTLGGESADILGVEMEGAAVASVVHSAPCRPRFSMIRGVSDFGDAQKAAAEGAGWRRYACEAAAAYTIGLLKAGYPLLDDSDRAPG
jgi:nucleoside phosphorylase